MFASLYTIGFIASLLSLTLWFTFKENKWAGQLFGKTLLFALMAYAAGLFFVEGGVNGKMFILCRDMGVLAVLSVLFSFMSKSRLALIAMFIAAGAFFRFYYLGEMQTSFSALANNSANTEQKQSSNTESTIKLDTDGELLVDIREGEKMSSLEKIINKYDLEYKTAFPNVAEKDITELDDYLLVNIPAKYENKRADIINELINSGLFDDVEENEIYNIAPVEGTQENSNKIDYGVNDPGIGSQWSMEALEMNKLYNVMRSGKIKPKKKALIAILDTGIDSKHQDIKGNYKSIDVRSDADKNSHGTHCAGIANAVTNNGIGIASFSPDNSFTQVASVKVLADYGGGTQRGIIQGMIRAADNGADVISMSLGGKGDASRQRAYDKAVKYANKKGAIVVVAAGNSSANAKDYVPAGCKGVIAVSAVDSNLKPAVFTNEVTDVKMGIAAPGVNIYSTIPKDSYKSYNGTSMACPHVAGLLGVMKAVNPDLTTKQAYDILNKTGKRTKNTTATGKFIYPVKAIEMAAK